MSDLVPLPPENIRVVACPNPFSIQRVVFEADIRRSLLEIICEVQPNPRLRRKVKVSVNGEVIDKEHWAYYYPAPGSLVNIRVVPQGFIVPIIIGIASIIAQAGIAYAIPGTLGIILGTLAALAISVVGFLIMGALIKPPSTENSKQDEIEETPTRYLSGARNRLVPYGVVPVICGRIRMTPPLAAGYYTELTSVTQVGIYRQLSPTWTKTIKTVSNQPVPATSFLQTWSGEWTGEEQWLRMMVCWGCGPNEITDMRIAQTELSYYQGLTVEHRAGYLEDPLVNLFSRSIYEEALGIEVTFAGSPYDRETGDDADEFSLDIGFQGLYKINKEYGGKENVTVNFAIYYRRHSETGSFTLAGYLNVNAARMGEIRRGFSFVLPERGKYTVRVQRTTTNSSDTSIVDKSYWTALRTITYEYPVKEVGVTLTAIKIKASDQLQGAVDELNGIAHSIRRDWDKNSQQWVLRRTRNPASHILYILTDPEVNQRAVDDSRVNLENLQEFHEWCELNKFYCNFVFDSSVSVEAALELVANTGRATMGMPDNKFGVVIDKPRDLIAQHFGPRNSWNFRASQMFVEEIHGFRVDFPDEENNFEQTPVTIYADGFHEGNATKFEELRLDGVTNYEHVYKLARYFMAVAEYQREIISFDSDFEYLTCQRGERIKFSHDVMLIGLGTGRVKATDRNNVGYVTHVVLDELITMEYGTSYNIRFRLKDGESLLANVVNPTVSGSDPIQLDYLEFQTPINPGTDNPPEVGDLWFFGEAGVETEDLLILSIQPNSDLTATLTCTIYSENVYTAADGPIVPYVPKITIPIEWNVPVIAGIYSDGSVLYWAQGGWQSRILVTFTYPPMMPGKYVAIQGEIRRYGEDEGSWIRKEAPLTEGEISFTQVEDGCQYEMRFRYVKSMGYAEQWTDPVTHTVEGKTAPPDDVTGFQAYQDHGLIILKWTEVPDKDLKEYEIKYCAAGSATWASAPVLTTATKGTNMTTKAIPQGVYDFFIKAVDLSGNESDNVAAVYGVRVLETYLPILMLYQGDYGDVGTQYSPTGFAADGFQGLGQTFTNLVYDYMNNVWRPDDQDAANSWYGLSCLGYFVVSPYTQASWESAQWTMPADVMRAWIQAECIHPYSTYEDYGKTGSWNPAYQIKTWKEGESEPDWKDEQVCVFGGGVIETWKIKFKLSWEMGGNSNTTYYNLFALRNMTFGLDKAPQYVSDTALVAIGGTTIKYGVYFGGYPSITANVIGGEGISVLVSDITWYESTYTIVDEDGDDVGGEINWIAQSKVGDTFPGGA